MLTAIRTNNIVDVFSWVAKLSFNLEHGSECQLLSELISKMAMDLVVSSPNEMVDCKKMEILSI